MIPTSNQLLYSSSPNAPLIKVPNVVVGERSDEVSPAGMYPNPLGLQGPRMRGRKNRYTDWSCRVDPGTCADLLPLLDEVWDGGDYRHVMIEQEEVSCPLVSICISDS
jgi:hypothetical protein